MENLQLVKDYRDNDKLRESLNNLTEATFQFNFKGWYASGYWRDKYIPYSIVCNDRVIANVSVNITDFMWDGVRHKFVQLGTVMTAEEYRNQGLIRRIMEEIDKDYFDKVDGMYLFAGRDVLEFYPKFGYKKIEEYQYSKKVNNTTEATIVNVRMDEKKDWITLENAMKNNTYYNSFDMVDNGDLIMFYITGFMQGNVYYNQDLDAWVIAELNGAELFIHNVFANKEISLDDIITSFGKDIKSVTLGFTPKNKQDFDVKLVKKIDTNMLVKGEGFNDFSKKKCMIPILSHA